MKNEELIYYSHYLWLSKKASIHDCCHSQSLKKCEIWKKMWNKRCMIHVIMRFGAPLKIVSNKRLQFTNEVMKDLLTHFVIKHKFTTMYEHSTNDLVERTNKIFCSMLIKKLKSKQIFVIRIARSTMSCVFIISHTKQHVIHLLY